MRGLAAWKGVLQKDRLAGRLPVDHRPVIDGQFIEDKQVGCSHAVGQSWASIQLEPTCIRAAVAVGHATPGYEPGIVHMLSESA